MARVAFCSGFDAWSAVREFSVFVCIDLSQFSFLRLRSLIYFRWFSVVHRQLYPMISASFHRSSPSVDSGAPKKQKTQARCWRLRSRGATDCAAACRGTLQIDNRGRSEAWSANPWNLFAITKTCRAAKFRRWSYDEYISLITDESLTSESSRNLTSRRNPLWKQRCAIWLCRDLNSMIKRNLRFGEYMILVDWISGYPINA